MHRLVGGFAVLAALTVITQAVSFVALAVAARRLGPADFGVALFALNLAAYIAIPVNAGIGLVGTRAIARRRSDAGTIAARLLLLRGGVGALVAVSLVVLAPLISPGADIEAVLPLAAAVVVADAVSGEWMLFGLERTAGIGVSRFAGQAVYAILVVAYLGDGIEGARTFVVLTAVSIAIASASSLVLALRIAGPLARPSPAAWLSGSRAMLAESVPLITSSMTWELYVVTGSLMLAYMEGAGELGQFGAAQKIPLALLGLAGLWSSVLLAYAARKSLEDRAALMRHVGTLVSVGIALASAVSIGAALVAEDLVVRVFGADYDRAALPFALLIAAFGVSVTSTTLSSVLIADGDERRYTLIVLASVIVSIGLNLVAIPALGVTGAAATAVAVEVLVLGWLTVRYRRIVGPVALDRPRLASGVAAVAAMAATVLVVRDAMAVEVAIVLSALAFAVAAVVFGLVRPQELRAVIRPS